MSVKVPVSDFHINVLTLEETVDHVTPEFPYMTNLCDLHGFPENSFPWHWHNEVEFFYMRKGELDYLLPGGRYHFQEGEMAFINANVLHMTVCEEALPCVQEEHIFLPGFIGGPENSVFYENYIRPVTSQPGLEIFRFDKELPEYPELLSLFRKSFDLYTGKPLFYEFDIREHMTRIWKKLFLLLEEQHLLNPDEAVHKKDSSKRLKAMMAFISQHYPERLTLEQIAGSGFVSVRECNRCFKDSLGMSPFSYLMDYRLRKACDFLRYTDLSVTQVGLACGFAATSYFGKEFHKRLGLTPREYRRQRAQAEAFPERKVPSVGKGIHAPLSTEGRDYR